MTWYCKSCGSEDVEAKVWFNILQEFKTTPLVDVADKDIFCIGCGDFGHGITQEQPSQIDINQDEQDKAQEEAGIADREDES